MSGPRTPEARRVFRYALQATGPGIAVSVVVLALTVGRDTAPHLRAFPWFYIPLLFGLVACAWMANGARVWILSRSLGKPLPYGRALAVALSAEFGVAATPGGTGGTVVLLLWRFFTFHLYLLTGSLVFVWTLRHPRSEVRAVR